MANILSLYVIFGITSVFGLQYGEYKRFLEEQSKNATFMKLFENHLKNFHRTEMKNEIFPCEPFRLNKNATTVHELTPADVSVIGAIGDSITAGTGITAKTPIGLLRQDRGLSWSGGGDGTIEDHITLANILKHYNPKLKGFSVQSGDFESDNAHLNVADPGNEARNMPFQARLLVDRLKSGQEGVDFQNDWKVITMFIGGNDLCNYCGDKPEYTVEKYIGYITEALDVFHKEIPKAFVNVVETLDIANVPLLNENLVCDTLHYFTCKCGAFPGSDENHKELRELVHAYQKGLEKLVASGRYDTRDDFTVVSQPFFTETKIPVNSDGTTDLDYFAPDCFHFSELGQQSAAAALWDNMIQPVGMKRKYWKPKEPTECPDTENPYLFTKKNSQSLLGKDAVGASQDNGQDGSDFIQDVSNDDQPEILKTNPASESKDNTFQFNITIIGGVVGVLILVVAVTISVYKLKKYSIQKRSERKHLLSGLSPSYTEI